MDSTLMDPFIHKEKPEIDGEVWWYGFLILLISLTLTFVLTNHICGGSNKKKNTISLRKKDLDLTNLTSNNLESLSFLERE